ncbi:MAG: hypothetical protein V1708_01720 [Candidatus Micrarchaeota archaeon]
MVEYPARMLYLFGVVLVLLSAIALFVFAVYRMKSRRESARDEVLEADFERQQMGFARHAIELELQSLESGAQDDGKAGVSV